MTNRLLETKFHVPPWRTGGVTRQHLLERLHRGLIAHRKLTLVSAPAGYGKTTLVTEWLFRKTDRREIGTHGPPSRAGWLSLDEGDNDPARFLAYWVAAFRRMDDALGQGAQSLLGMPQLPPLTAIADELLNDLATLEAQVVLVLDDYHVITNPQLHDLLTYFVEHQPAQVHLAITTREDPPLPLARMRARGQMTEIRVRDLRFTADEAGRFFSQSMRLDLDSETVSTLGARTEGWAVGLQLAALALQNFPDQRDFLADFSGSHRHIIDYLLDEVLEHQTPEVRDFLSRTASLQRFNAALCQAVTANPRAADILSQLERNNLFLVPLDDARGWYRYHHLFADVLRAGLDEQTQAATHRIAAGWFEGAGLAAEAISHWLAVPSATEAARLIDDLAGELIKNGELQTLYRWLEALPDTVVDTNPDLVTHKALCLLMTGQILPAREYAAQAYQTFAGQARSAGLGRLLVIQAWFASAGGDAQTGDLARAALEQLDEGDDFFRALALIALGTSLAWDAHLPASTQVFRDAWALGRKMNHPFIALGALANLAFNLLEMGKLREAESLCRAALSTYVDSSGKHLPTLGIIYAPLACICYEKGDFDEAKALAERAIDLCRRLFSHIILGGDSEVTLARIAFSRGQPQQAFDLLESAAESARRRGMMIVVYKMTVVHAELCILQGRQAEAELKLQEVDTLAQSVLTKSGLLATHLRARYLAASGKPTDALEVLDSLARSDRDESWARRLMDVQVAQALIYQQQGDAAQAGRVFEAALGLAISEGYRTPFLPHPGRPTGALLRAARGLAPGFVDSILDLCTHAGGESVPTATLLLDPLTDQEQRVLELLMAGKTNADIADDLVISVGTAKWHVHNVLQKLDVSNRSQAIPRARELGIA